MSDHMQQLHESAEGMCQQLRDRLRVSRGLHQSGQRTVQSVREAIRVLTVRQNAQIGRQKVIQQKLLIWY